MNEKYSASAKVYDAGELGEFSLLDLLAYFQEHGAMRVSDLHIKVGTPPTYRIDGNLVKLKGPPVSQEVAVQLIHPFVDEETMKRLGCDCPDTRKISQGMADMLINWYTFKDSLGPKIS